MLFFQCLLLFGYLYSHTVSSRLRPAVQTRLHILVAILSCLSLPIVANDGWKPTGAEEPVSRVLMLLATTIGLPYFVLSTTNPLLSSWVARHYSPAQAYRMFALSNLGALIALFTYPILVEPQLAVLQQAKGWSLLYCLFVGLVSLVSYQSSGHTTQQEVRVPQTQTSRALLILCGCWIALSACSSTLLISLTNFLTQNVAAIPFLWIIPLALFLLSYIVTFSYPALYVRWLFWPASALAIGYLSYNLTEDSHNQPLTTMIPMIGMSLFVLCVMCHGELSKSRPHKSHLTLYYLMSSLGGALGGVFVGIISPLVFVDNLELPIALVVTLPVSCFTYWYFCRTQSQEPDDSDSPLAIQPMTKMSSWALLACVAFISTMAVWRIQLNRLQDGEEALLSVRNFYGPMRVDQVGEGASQRRRLTHGTIQHGCQFRSVQLQRTPTTYYSDESGIGLAIVHSRTSSSSDGQKVGIIGLGTGTIAAYGRAQDEYVYYELNPLVEKIAREQFTFLSSNPAKGRVALGDARITLEREPLQAFDILAVDAFSSDSIPVHLLTREAFDLYFRSLKPNGTLLIHISNRYLDLQPVIQSYVDGHKLKSFYVHNSRDKEMAINSATWVAVGNASSAAIRYFEEEKYPGLDAVPSDFKPWTDSYSNLIEVLDQEELPEWLRRKSK
jgi:spermidine synthase